METKKKHIDELHFEHKLWRSELLFFADELKIYKDRLSEIASKNTNEEVLTQVEHFQNSFVIQKEQLDMLNHDIKVHEQALGKFAKENPVAIEHHLFDSHATAQERMDTFRKLYTELKHEFIRFLEKWM